jgi:hypothetical protein
LKGKTVAYLDELALTTVFEENHHSLVRIRGRETSKANIKRNYINLFGSFQRLVLVSQTTRHDIPEKSNAPFVLFRIKFF